MPSRSLAETTPKQLDRPKIGSAKWIFSEDPISDDELSEIVDRTPAQLAKLTVADKLRILWRAGKIGTRKIISLIKKGVLAPYHLWLHVSKQEANASIKHLC